MVKILTEKVDNETKESINRHWNGYMMDRFMSKQVILVSILYSISYNFSIWFLCMCYECRQH